MWNASFNLWNVWNQLLIQQILKTFENMPKTSQDLLAPVLLQAAALRWCSRWSHRSQRNVSSCSKACSSVRHTSLVSENLTNQKRFKLRKRGKLLANKNYIKNLFLLLSHWSWKMGDGKYLSFKQPRKVYAWVSQALSLHEVNIFFSWMDWDWKQSWYYIGIC